MNGKDIFNAVGNIDDKYISEFADTSKFKKKKIFLLSPKFYGSIAAVFVLGIAVFIALQQKNRPSIDIQNDSVHNNTVISETKQTESIAEVSPESSIYSAHYDVSKDSEHSTNNIIPYSTPSKSIPYEERHNTDYIDIPFEEPHAYEEAPAATNENSLDVLFSIKVYAAEIPEKLSKNGSVQIKGDFDPLMSSSTGIGIEFQVTPYEPVTLQAESGYFVTWDKDSGVITEHGSSFTVSETTDFFWTFDGETNNTAIKVTDGNSVLSTINISYDESTNTFYAQNTE